MNAKRILNNYRNLGNVKMPRSVYKKGGSKPIPGYRVGGRLRRAQFNTNTDNTNSGSNTGMTDLGMMQFLEQNNPFITDESGNQILNPNAVFNPMQYYTLQGAAASGNMDLFNQVLASNLYDTENTGRYRNKKKAAKKKDEFVSSFVFGPDQTKQGFGSFLADVARGFITPENALNVVGMFQTGQSNKFNQELQRQMLDAGINPLTGMPITRRRGGTSPSTRLPKGQFMLDDKIMAMLNQAKPMTKNLPVKGSDIDPEMLKALIKEMEMRRGDRKLKSFLQNKNAIEALMNQPEGLIPENSEIGFLQQLIRQGLQQGVSPDMKRKGGAKRKAKYNVGGPYRDKAPMPGSNPLPEVPKRGLGGTAQERVQQMKHGGSMCRGLPGGPNEFPM